MLLTNLNSQKDGLLLVYFPANFFNGQSQAISSLTQRKGCALACSPVHYLQIGTFRPVVECSGYAALLTHRFERPPS